MTSAKQKSRDRLRVAIDTTARNAREGKPLTANGGRQVISEAEFFRTLNAALGREKRPDIGKLVSGAGCRVEQRGDY